jgi:hypothetical protein
MADKTIEYLLKLRAEGRDNLTGVAREADAAAQATRRADDAADDFAATSRRASDDVGEFGDRAGAVGGNAAKLAGALSLVDSGAAEAARTVADLADVGEVASVAARGLGISLTSVIGVLGPVAVAVGALAATWALLNAELEAAEARNLAAANAASAAADANAKWNETQEKVKLQFQLSSGAIDEQTARIRASNSAIEDAAAAQRTLLESQVATERAAYEGSGGSDRRALSTAERNLKEFSDQVETTKTQADLLITSEIEQRKAAEGTAAAQKAKAAATLQAADAERVLAAAQAAARAETEAREAAEESLGSIIAANYTAQERAAAQLRADNALISAAIDAGADYAVISDAKSAAMDRYAASVQAASDAQDGLAAAESDTAATMDVGGTLSTVGAAISDPLSAAAGADPTGITGGVIAIATAVSDLGGTLGSVTGLLNGVVDGLTTGGADVARFLGDVIGDLVPAILEAAPQFVLGLVEGMDDIIEGLVKGAPRIAFALIEILTPLFAIRVALAFVEVLADPQTWIDIGTSFVDGVAEGFRKLIDDLVSSFEGVFGKPASNAPPGAFEAGGFFDSLFAGSYAVGSDFVPRTGIALVHQGERIVPASGASSGTTAAAMGGGGGGVSVYLGGGLLYGTPDTLAREVGRAADRGIQFGG